MPTKQQYDIFISFPDSRMDSNGFKERTRSSHIAEKLYADLKRLGYNPFNSRSILGTGVQYVGEDFNKIIADANDAASVLVLLCEDPNDLMKPYIVEEWMPYHISGKPIVPVMITNWSMSDIEPSKHPDDYPIFRLEAFHMYESDPMERQYRQLLDLIEQKYSVSTA